MKSENLIQAMTFKFSLEIIQLYKSLVAGKEFVLSRQLLKSGTSIGANIEEAIAAQSRKDFISKMAITTKEAREARYWLKLLSQSNLTMQDCQSLLDSVEHIINILTKIVKTTQQGSPTI